MAVNGSVPVFGQIVPHLVVRDTEEALSFYQRVFKAELVYRSLPTSSMGEHLHLKMWGSLVQISTEEPGQRKGRIEGALLASPETLSGSTCLFQVRVEDVDAIFRNAVDEGASPAWPPTDMFWGDRYGWIRDPFGHIWAFSAVKEILSPEEVGFRLRRFAEELKGREL